MIFGLPSRDLCLQARLTMPALLSSLPNLTLLPKTKTSGAGKIESFFPRKIRLHVVVCQKCDANLVLYCYLRLAEKSSRL